uniref:Uncharacterized protein n=1 Tax=Scophthalmus maximus TaxID=52904 RepID=A0A8D3BTT9_SCOMX
ASQSHLCLLGNQLCSGVTGHHSSTLPGGFHTHTHTHAHGEDGITKKGQGCVDGELCGSREIVSHRGVEYNVSHACCCEDKCNGPPKSDASVLTLTLTFISSLQYWILPVKQHTPLFLLAG